jgi:superfamily II DNA or RNA helicase
MLRDQWAEEVQKLYKMPVGLIGSGEYDIDHSIVIGNIQTLTKIVPDICKEFGTVIVDECHHVTASTFTSFLDGMYARYKIGLSGTMSRKDGKHILFKDFFGPKLYQPPQENTMDPTVQIIKTGVSLAAGEPWVTKINLLLYDPDYQEFIANLARYQIDRGHKVLIIADRVEFLKNVGELLGETCVCITGETTYEQRIELKRQIEDGEKSAIAGSRQIFSEGISVNILSCVILAVPISNDSLLEQIVGRIQRNHVDKLTPLVLDLHFSGPADRKQNNMRMAFYQRKGWDIKE